MICFVPLNIKYTFFEGGVLSPRDPLCVLVTVVFCYFGGLWKGQSLIVSFLFSCFLLPKCWVSITEQDADPKDFTLTPPLMCIYLCVCLCVA